MASVFAASAEVSDCAACWTRHRVIFVNPAASVFAASGDSASAVGAATAATTSPRVIHLLRLANMTSFLLVVSAAHAVVSKRQWRPPLTAY